MITERELRALRNIVRIGTVSSVDSTTNTARVAYDDKPDTEGTPLVSAPLKIVSSGEEWLPTVGQFVLCLYLPHGESDGFIMGVI